MPIAAAMYYFSYHEGAVNQPPVLLIHGAGGDYQYWPPQLRRLRYGRIYAPDLPGHGRSGKVGCQYIEDYARAVVYFMDALGIYSAVVVGHSMGGAIALQLALDWPQRVLGLGLVATGAHLPVAPQLLDAFARSETVPAGIDIIISWAFSQQADNSLQNLARRRMMGIRQPVLYGDFLACSRFDVRARLGEIRVPALILAGGADRMTPLRFSDELRNRLPNASLQIFPEAGHMLMLEQPEATAQALEDWLRSWPYRAGQ